MVVLQLLNVVLQFVFDFQLLNDLLAQFNDETSRFLNRDRRMNGVSQTVVLRRESPVSEMHRSRVASFRDRC